MCRKRSKNVDIAVKKKRRVKKLTALISSLLIIVIFVSVCAFMWFGTFSRIVSDLFQVGLDYISFEHPLDRIDWEDLLTEVTAASEAKEHPYVLVTQDEFDSVRTEYYSADCDTYLKDRMDYAIAKADEMLTLPLIVYELDADGKILELSREVLNREMALAGAYQITGNSAYAARALAEIENVCNFDDWHPSHFLDAMEMSMSVSLGYDWLYDYLTEEQRGLIAEKVYNYGIKPGDPDKLISNWWSWSKVNWNTQCYGGIGVACMVFADYYPEEAAKFLSDAYYNMPYHFESFSPDGSYVEGNSYWEATTSYLTYFVSTSRNFLDTDHGLSTLPGFDKIGYYPLYISAPLGVFNYSDNRNNPLYAPSLHWFASEYNEPMLTYFQTLSVKEADLPRESMLSCLWYDLSMDYSPEELDVPLSVYLTSDKYEEFVAMRSAYCDVYATYTAMKSGDNYSNHGDLDIGTFVFDALGERWVMDLGKSSYSLPGYFNGLIGGGRWRVYIKRAEGHNTLVINPDMANEDQYPFAKVKFTSFEPSAGGGLGTMDMTDAYIRNGVTSSVRSIEMYDGYKNLRITDTVTLDKPGEIYWFAHTEADIEISGDGKTATLSITNPYSLLTHQVIVKIAEGSDGTFEVMSTLPLSDKKRFAVNTEIEGVQKLAIHLTNVTEANIAVTFEPVYED